MTPLKKRYLWASFSCDLTTKSKVWLLGNPITGTPLTINVGVELICTLLPSLRSCCTYASADFPRMHASITLASRPSDFVYSSICWRRFCGVISRLVPIEITREPPEGFGVLLLGAFRGDGGLFGPRMHIQREVLPDQAHLAFVGIVDGGVDFVNACAQ